MKSKTLLVIGLILTGWASWTHMTSGFNAKEVHSALFLLCAYAIYYGVISTKFDRPVRVIAPMFTNWVAGVCVLYTTLPSYSHRWLQEFSSTLKFNQEALGKIFFLACFTLLIIVVNTLIFSITNLFKKQKRGTKEFVFVQVMILFVFGYNSFAVKSVEERLTKEKVDLTEVPNAIVQTIKATLFEKEGIRKNPENRITHIDPNFDVRLKEKSAEEISAGDLNRFLHGVLEGKGEVFVRMGKKYKINPLFLTSIAIHESGNGSSRAARQCNNPLGIMYGKDSKKHRKFDSIDKAIEYTAKQLAQSGYYIKKGKCTVAEIQKVYCPVGAKNDPKKLNSGWLPGVLSWMNKIHKQANPMVASN